MMITLRCQRVIQKMYNMGFRYNEKPTFCFPNCKFMSISTSKMLIINKRNNKKASIVLTYPDCTAFLLYPAPFITKENEVSAICNLKQKFTYIT